MARLRLILAAVVAGHVDGRSTRVQLTAQGKKVIEDALPDHLRTQEALLAGLDAEEQARFILLLQRMELNTRGVASGQ